MAGMQKSVSGGRSEPSKRKPDRGERLKSALKANISRRKAQLQEQAASKTLAGKQEKT